MKYYDGRNCYDDFCGGGLKKSGDDGDKIDGCGGGCKKIGGVG